MRCQVQSKPLMYVTLLLRKGPFEVVDVRGKGRRERQGMDRQGGQAVAPGKKLKKGGVGGCGPGQ